MTLPTPVKTWTISPNNRITFVSLLDTTQRFLHGMKTFLLAHGYTTVGSVKSGAGGLDGVDRWTATTDVTPRGATQGASNAWWVGQDASGAQICLAFVGATDDCARVSFSPSGSFSTTQNSGPITMSVSSVAKTFTRITTGGDAGTSSFLLDGFVNGDSVTFSGFTNAGNNATFTLTSLTATVMTASGAAGLVTESNSSGTAVVKSNDVTRTPACKDSMLIWDAASIHGSTASGDRIWHGWVDSTSKLCRFAIGRAGAAFCAFGMELVTPLVGSTTTFSPAVWGFAYNGTGSTEVNITSTYNLNSNGGLAKLLVGSAQYACTLGGGLTLSGASLFMGATVNQLNDDSHPVVEIPYALISNKANATGRAGQRLDWWMGYSGAVDGDVYTGKTLMHVIGQVVWPWDGTTTPTYT